MRASIPMLYTSHKVVGILPIQASGAAIKLVVKIPVRLEVGVEILSSCS